MIFNTHSCADCGQTVGAVAPAQPAERCAKCGEIAALRSRLATAEAEVSRLQGALIDGVQRLVEEGNAKIPKQFRTFESPDQIGDAFRFAESRLAESERVALELAGVVGFSARWAVANGLADHAELARRITELSAAARALVEGGTDAERA